MNKPIWLDPVRIAPLPAAPTSHPLNNRTIPLADPATSRRKSQIL